MSGIGFGSKVSGNVAGSEILDSVYDFVQSETITSTIAPALDTPAAPVVYSLSDVAGPTTGGEIVIVSGYGFIGVTTVTMGGTNVTDFEVVSPYRIDLITPAKTAGSHNVVVTNATGASATGAQTAYVYS